MIPKSPVWRHAITVGAVLSATAVRLALDPVLGAHVPYLPFTFAVMLAARLGGRSSGFLATALSAVSVAFFILAPRQLLTVGEPNALWGLGVFCVFSSFISLLVGDLRGALLRSAAAEEALRQKGQLIELSHDAILTTDAQRRIVTWNAGAERTYGWSSAEVVGQVTHELFQARTSISLQELDTILRREGHWEGQLTHTTRDGRELCVESRQALLRDRQGQPTGILSINRDVTERERALQALRASEERLLLAQRAARVSTFEWNVETGVNRWTPELEAMYGLSPGGFPGTREAWEELVHPGDRAAAVESMHRTLETGEPVEAEWRVIWPDGTVHWLAGRFQGFKDAAGRPVRLTGVNIDVTERKRAEEALRESESRLQAVLDSLPVAVFTADSRGQLQDANDAAREIWGHTPMLAMGEYSKEYRGWWPETGRRVESHEWPMARAVQGETVRDVTVEIESFDGKRKFQRIAASPIRGPRGENYGAVAITEDITAQREGEERLRESERRYRVLFDSMEEGFMVGEVILDSDGQPIDWRYLDVNPALSSMWQLPANEIIGRTYREVFPEATWEYWVKGFGEVALTGRPARLEHYGSGSRRYYAATVYSPAPRQFAALLTDVTERKRAEEALKASEQRYRTLFESMQESFAIGEMILDAAGNPVDWRYLEINPAFERTFGYTRNEIIGHTYRELFPLAPWQYWVPALGEVAKTGNPARLEHRAPDDRHFEAIAYSPSPGQFAAVFPDVTERRNAEEALRQAKQINDAQLAKLEAIVGSMTDGLVLGSQDGNILDLNPAALKLHGFSSVDEARMLISSYPDTFDVTDLQGKALPTDEWPLARAARGETFSNVELRVRRKDTGKEFIGNYSGSLVRDSSARELLAMLTIRDVTERKQAEERLRHAQKMESIGLLAGGVAHDFNNLLTVIMGSASSALTECSTCEHSRAILAASERAAYLTQQLLAYAGKSQVVTKKVDVTQLVSAARPLLAASLPKRVTLLLHLSDDLPPVQSDPSRIEQIVMNLVINAGEAIPPKVDGRIDVTTGALEVSAEMARKHSRQQELAPGQYVWLEVRDNGAGMDQETVSRIFDPFFTTKFTGRGLGLAAVDGIVRSSNGFIDVRSAVGAGATFRVYLPAVEGGRREVAPARLLQPRSRQGSSTVLVVDDEELVRKWVSLTLRMHGYEVVEARDGKDALQVLREARVLPTVVFLDLAMPRMGGDELIPLLAAEYPALKILVSSGYPEEEARKNFPQEAVDAFLQKPFTAAALLGAVADILTRRPGPGGTLVDFPTSR